MERNIVFGRHPVNELLKSNHPIEKIFVLQSLKGPYEIELRKACKQLNIPLIRTKSEQLNKISGGRNHQGIVAISSAIQFQQLEEIIPFIYENNEQPLILILDHITDVRNFGAIARSAEIFGVHALVVPKKGTAAITEDAIKASSGALLKIPVCRYSNLKDAIIFLKDSGIHVAAANPTADQEIETLPTGDPIAIVLGAEGKGIQKELLKESNSFFKIQQSGSLDSLNVSVAAGIILYEVQKKR